MANIDDLCNRFEKLFDLLERQFRNGSNTSRGIRYEDMFSDVDRSLKDVVKHIQDMEDGIDAWDVKPDGCICYKGHSRFVIEANALTCGNRLTEVLSKVLEIDNATTQFYFAFLQALKNAGYSSITIDLNNLHKSIIAK